MILSGRVEMRRLLETMACVEEWITDGDPLPEFTTHRALLSLPLVMNTTIESIPTAVPYLHAEPSSVECWRQRVPNDSRLKVGLVWSGNTEPDASRSLPFKALAPLGCISDIWYCSLQKGAASQDTTSPPTGLTVVNWSDELHDFADTAALIVEIGKTPLTERSFDICILIDVIEHVRDPENFLNQVWRILKDGAVIFIATPSVDSWSARALGRCSRKASLGPPNLRQGLAMAAQS